MKVQALIVFMSALTVPYGSTTTLPKDTGAPAVYPIMEQRDVHELDPSEDASLCFFLKEKDVESDVSCKPRLTRSKFNYNPFGLRFGKRDRRLKSDSDRLRTSRLLPLLLSARDLEEAS
uniref:Kisspeptin 2 n=1 Tax=Electrophorus electricus TaxID=8005 RepID=A0A4W4FAU0_ELEEL